MSSRFNHLKKMEIPQDRTAEFTIYALENEPVLIMSPASETNRDYFNGLLKRSRRTMSRVQAKAITPAVTKENRDDDRRLYAEHVVKGWRRVIDDTGAEVPFSQGAVEEYLFALPDYIFDDVRFFATSPYNFLDEVPDAEEVAGNSPNA